MIKKKMMSSACGREIEFGIVIPPECRHIFIMLHGHGGTPEDVDKEFPLDEYAEKYRLMIVIPELGNDYYLDRAGIPGEDDFPVSEILGTELPAFIKNEYGMDEKTGVILGGYSMGGFGAMLHGLNMPEKFMALISVSGAFIANEIAFGSAFVVGDETCRKAAFKMFMIKDGEYPCDVLPYDAGRNPEASVENMSEDLKKKLPPIVMTCGEKDIWCMTTHRMRKLMIKKNISFYFMETPDGDHDFKVFDEGFRFAFDKIQGFRT